MNPAILQKQLRDNASDLQDFCKDLKVWGDEMKRKEGPTKAPKFDKELSSIDNKKRKTANDERKVPTKICEITDKPAAKSRLTDYSAWDKFDVEAECEKVDYDENEESDLTDESDELVRDQALMEKEKGNTFVKNKKWTEAIDCYTKAIHYYALDPVFYANRALCYLKTDCMLKAETDCTMSLKLDKNYVKAYQRRAVAREALNSFEEAECDLLKVLQLEPNNKESQKALEDLKKKVEHLPKPVEEERRPVSQFAASRGQQKKIPAIVKQNQQPSQVVDCSKPSSHWPSGDDVLLVKTINKPPHLRSKKPLRRVEIEEISDTPKSDHDKVIENSKSVKSSAIIGNIIERHEPVVVNVTKVMSKETKNNNNNTNKTGESLEMVSPKNSVQFYECWRYLKSLESKYNYLKLLKPREIPDIFKESLDSGVFSDILQILAECFVKNNERVFDFLSFLTQVKRFSTLTMFMTSNDKNFLLKLVDYVKECEDKSGEEVDSLINKYEL